jgi:hypothetical protein
MNKTFELSVADLEELKKMTACIENQKLAVQMMDFTFQNFVLTILDKYGADKTKKYHIDTISGKIVEVGDQNEAKPVAAGKPVEEKPNEASDKGL